MNNLASYDEQWEQMERDRIAAEAAAAEKKFKKNRDKQAAQAEAEKKAEQNDVHEE